MKSRTLWLIIISSTSIFFALLFYIQIRWLIETAETEKKHFTQSVKLSLDYTMHQIMSDQKLCTNIQRCLLDSQCMKTRELKKVEWQKIDSIIKSNLEYYDIKCDYKFDLEYQQSKQNVQNARTDELFLSGSNKIAYKQGNIQLIIQIPDDNEFIINRIGPMFIISLLLIILCVSSFIITVRLYFKNQKRSDLINNFIHNMAHEFKTPVAVIAMANSRIKNNLEQGMNGRFLKYTTIIENEKDKMEDHIESIFNLAYFESKQALLRIESTNIKKLIDSAILNVNTILEEKDGKIEFSENCENISVDCDRNHMINSLTNILDNASKYCHERPKISISYYKDKKHVVIQISDNGIGVSKKDLPYVFDKYFRVNTGNIHNIKGYGIGLSYVKEVVELHGGSIELESKQGKGSLFKIYLPLKNKKAEIMK